MSGYIATPKEAQDVGFEWPEMTATFEAAAQAIEWFADGEPVENSADTRLLVGSEVSPASVPTLAEMGQRLSSIPSPSYIDDAVIVDEQPSLTEIVAELTSDMVDTPANTVTVQEELASTAANLLEESDQALVPPPIPEWHNQLDHPDRPEPASPQEVAAAIEAQRPKVTFQIPSEQQQIEAAGITEQEYMTSMSNLVKGAFRKLRSGRQQRVEELASKALGDAVGTGDHAINQRIQEIPSRRDRRTVQKHLKRNPRRRPERAEQSLQSQRAAIRVTDMVELEHHNVTKEAIEKDRRERAAGVSWRKR